MILPKRFDIFSPLTGGCSKGLDAFRFFFKLVQHTKAVVVVELSILQLLERGWLATTLVVCLEMTATSVEAYY